MNGSTRLRLRPEATGRLLRSSVAVAALGVGAAGVAAIALAARGRPPEVAVAAAFVTCLAGAVAVALDVRRRRAVWSRFRVVLGEDGISTVGRVGGDLHVDFRAIRNVVETVWPARGLVVRGQPGRASLFVPAGLERYDEVRTRLARVVAIQQSRVPERLVRAWPVVIVLVCVAEALAIGATTPALVVPSALLLAVAGLWSLSNVLRSKRLSTRAKLLSLLLLGPVAWLGWRMWSVLR